MVSAYVGNRLYKTMIGQNEYAESFITSEWLYHSLKGTENYDLTAIISGYLKSIEQLLYTVVMMNIDNKCKIAMSQESQIREKAYNEGVQVYEKQKGVWKLWYPESKKEYKNKRYPYIDLIETQKIHGQFNRNI